MRRPFSNVWPFASATKVSLRNGLRTTANISRPSTNSAMATQVVRWASGIESLTYSPVPSIGSMTQTLLAPDTTCDFSSPRTEALLPSRRVTAAMNRRLILSSVSVTSVRSSFFRRPVVARRRTISSPASCAKVSANCRSLSGIVPYPSWIWTNCNRP